MMAEEKVIKPYLNIMENNLISDDKKNDPLKGYGIHDSGKTLKLMIM